MDSMQVYAVGELYGGEPTRWPETVTYSCRGGSHEMLFFASDLSSEEVRLAREAPLDLGLFVDGQLIVIVFRIPGLYDWSDSPYSHHLNAPNERQLPPFVAGEERCLLPCHFVDADTGILRANRFGTMSPEFTRQLHEAIRQQMGLPFNRHDYERDLARLFTTYPHPRDLLETAVARCRLGE